MCLITDTILDELNRPVAGAMVTIRNEAEELVELAAGNPVMSNSRGAWSAELEEGTYSVEIKKGSALISRSLLVCPCME